MPVATFGGAAYDIYLDEIKNNGNRPVGNISTDDYQNLNRILSKNDEPTLQTFAEQVVSLAEKAIASSNVFVIMSFEQAPHLIDAFNTFTRACKKRDFIAKKIDQHIDAKMNIVPAIFANIKSSAFIIAEVSGAKPNVYYELGYARALGKSVIQTAYKDTILPFDVFDIPTLFWDSQDTLEKRLDEGIGRIFSRADPS